MSDALSAKVLNGEVRVGDQVAVGVRDGNCGGIRLGTVVAIRITGTQRQFDYKLADYTDQPVYSVKVQLTASSEWLRADDWSTVPPRWYGTDNMVRAF